MSDVVLFHHVQGLTAGTRAFADALRAGGHVVHTPDLFEGVLPATLPEGLGHIRALGEDLLDARAAQVVAQLPEAVVFGGFSWGAAIAQRYAQTRSTALAALLFEACLPVSGRWAIGSWPAGVPVQVHGMGEDEFFAGEGDLDAARELVAQAGPDVAELFVYPGKSHLFTDSSLPSYDEAATTLVIQRSLDLLARLH